MHRKHHMSRTSDEKKALRDGKREAE